jgi:phytoene dehydrogenase-like protein
MGIILITNIMSEPFPTEGMNSITSLVKLAEDIGVNFVYNSPVEEILVDTLQKKLWSK